MKSAPEIASTNAPQSAVSIGEQRRQLEKVLRSEVFRPAPGLQKFLEYVASKAIDGLPHEIKEYTIGTDVFSRSGDYDPRIDTVVRVQAHRLREKLKEYYDGEGVGDEILLVIPKGHYVPYFSRRAAPGGTESDTHQITSPLPSTRDRRKEAPRSNATEGLGTVGSIREPKKISFRWLLMCLAGMALLLGAVFLLPHLRNDRSPQEPDRARSGASSVTSTEGPLKDLWADFLKEESSPIVAYSNSVFLVTDTSDLLRLKTEEVDNLGAPAGSDAARKLVVNPRMLDHAGPVFFEDVYTGTGEVMAVFYLTRLFAQFHSSLGVRRSRLITTDDLTHHDLIFLGSTRENAFLAGIPLTQDFVFDWPPKFVGVWSGRILNLHPQPGERSFYEVERDPKARVLRADYAVVTFLPGIAPNRKIAILGGLTTLGTQAAADFATSPSQIAELAARLETGPGISPKRIPQFFQAVLRVEIMKGDVLSVKCVAGHVIHPAQHPSPKS